ncbi:hypothetical protein, partial [Faecalibaculum rodentium]|uniref:hypothetical protein n=1 Tax=Faecalibaculum rodentium TaxID=1702221 RepID=UPI0025A67C72
MNSICSVDSALKDYSALSFVCENTAPYCLDPVANLTRKRKLTPDKLITFLDRLPSSVNGLSRINSASNNAILESGREAPYVQEIAV